MNQLFPHRSLEVAPNSVTFVYDENVPEKLKAALEKFNEAEIFPSSEGEEYENSELVIPALISFITEYAVTENLLTEEEADEFADLDNLTVGAVTHIKNLASVVVLLYYSSEEGEENEEQWD